MRTAALGCLLLAACGASPRKDFDDGVAVHFILVRERPPERDVTLEPIYTVGETVARPPAVTFGPDHELAREAAVLRTRKDENARVSFWDPVTRTRAERTVDTRHELWIVIEIDELGGTAVVSDERRPPHRDLQEWVPLAEMPH